jgi:hypothetical protein
MEEMDAEEMRRLWLLFNGLSSDVCLSMPSLTM